MAPACELEGLPSAVDRSLSGVFSERKGELQPDGERTGDRSDQAVHARRRNRKTGHRLKQQNIDFETGEVVSERRGARV